MKHGSEYAKEVKRLFRQMLKQFGKPAVPEPTDPIEQLIIGMLAACTTDVKAQAAYRKLREQMVDLNELRVTPPMELAELLRESVPLARDKAQRIVDALNAVRRRQDKLDLSFLKQRGRREARDYLEALDGVNRAAAASVVLYSLGGHAIPVDELTVYVLRQEEVVDPLADLAEVQAFLERHVSAADAPVFAALLGRHVAAKGARVPLERLRELLKPPSPANARPAAGPTAKPTAGQTSKPAAQPVESKNGKQAKPAVVSPADSDGQKSSRKSGTTGAPPSPPTTARPVRAKKK
jgi:endonuclease III